MNGNELPKKILWTSPGGQRGRGRRKSRWIDRLEDDTSKLGCINCRADVQGRGRRRHLLEKAQGCRADDDDDDDDDDDVD